MISIKDCGAVGDSVTDDTDAIQAALDADLHVTVPPGLYSVSRTLHGRPNHRIEGLTPEICQFVRKSAYGDTLRIGDDAVSPKVHGGAAHVTGVWFNHQYEFNNGNSYVPGTSTSLFNKDQGATHLRLYAAQNVRVTDCWFSGLGYGIMAINTASMWFERNNFNGCWDEFTPGLQDTTASIALIASAPGERCADLTLRANRFGGCGPGVPRAITTGDKTVNKALNVGPRFGVWIQSCEEFSITENYFGGHGYHNLYMSAHEVLCHGHIANNMFDAGAHYSIKIDSQSNASFPALITISNNTGVGYGIDEGFIHIHDTGFPLAASYISISDNIAQMYYRCAIRVEKAVGVKVTDNQIAAYNSDGSTTVDPFVQAGAVFDANCRQNDSHGNTWGGGINSVEGPNNCKWGVYFYNNQNTASMERGKLGISGGTVVGGIVQSYPT